MIRKIIWLLLTLFLIIALSCVEKHENDILVLDTQSTPLDDVPLSQIFSNSGMVILETNESCMLGTILQVVKSGDDIYIVDFRMNGGFYGSRISKFDKTGRFIRWIGNQGNGPGEYHSVAAIAADTLNDKIIAISGKEVLVYHSDGSFNYSYPSELNSSIDNMYVHNDTLLVFNHEYDGKEERKVLYFYHHSTKIDSLVLRRYYSRVNILLISNNCDILSNLNSGTYIYDPVRAPEPFLRDTLYRIIGKKLIPSVKLDFASVLTTSDYNIPEDVSPFDVFTECNKVRNITLKDIYRTPKYLFADYSLDSTDYKYCYDLIKHKGFRSQSGFRDDVFGTGQICNPKPLDAGKGEFYFSVNGIYLDGIIPGVNENSNPVIFLVKTNK